MGYGAYKVIRNGEEIEAGYLIEAECEAEGCTTRIDRGLDQLCGEVPGGDENGCGGYFCSNHMMYYNTCESCGAKKSLEEDENA